MNEESMREFPMRILRNAEAVLPDRILLTDLILQGALIQSLASPGEAEVAGATVHDVAGRRVTPGMIDLHVHGGWGVDFYRDDPERVAESAARFEAIGVTTLLLTLHPGPEEELLDRLASAAHACDLSPAFAGIHLEGPFIAIDRKGALPEAGILPFSDALFERILTAAGGKLRLMTFAPEAIPTESLRTIRSLGIILSIGHTSCDAAATRAAVDAGAWRCTHLCNAMPPMHHRSPGPISELLLDRRVRCELIVDGEHVDDRIIALARRLKGPEGILAVSDATPLAGLGPAAGTFCGFEVHSDGKRATLPDGTLAGSVMFLPDAVHRTGVALGLTPSERVALGSTAAALDLGLRRTGRIGRGCRADLVIWEDENPTAVLRGGDGSLPEAWRIR